MLFVHGHKFVRHHGKYYTSGSLNNKLFSRYTDVFHDVTVFANQKEADDSDFKYINDQNKVDNVHLILMNNSTSISKLIRNRKKLKEAVSLNQDIVIRMPSIYGVLAAMYTQKSNKKYLIELVGCPWDAYWNHSLKGRIFAPLMWLATKVVVKNAHYVLYVTSEFLQNRYPTKGVNIGCSDVALPELDGGILEKRISKILNMKSSNPIKIGTTAAVNIRYKGQEFVIEAISRLNREGFNFEYHLAGGGDNSYLKSVAKKFNVEDKIKFLGSLPHAKVFEYLDDIDIYIQPSLTEGMPRSLIEAMSRGCLCLGTDVGGIPELVNYDLIFNKKSVEEIVDIITHLDIDDYLNEASTNFEKAKLFEDSILSKNRENLYKNYLERGKL